jgi:hypothetical protein
MYKSLPIEDVMDIIKGSNIQYMAQYQRFYRDNNLKNLGIPYSPQLTYGDKFPGVDKFLGNPEGTALKASREVLSNNANKNKPWNHIRKGTKKARNSQYATKPVLPVLSDVQPVIVPAKSDTASFASIVKTLHEEYNIPLATLYTLNEEAKKTSLMKVEAINETLTVLVKIAMQKVNPKVKV